MTGTDLLDPGEGVQVRLRDEALNNKRAAVEMLLTLARTQLTARDLIAERVRAECDRRLIDLDGQQVAPLVMPSAAEKALNGVKLRLPLKRDGAEAQVEKALSAFEQNAFLLLVDDDQVDTLDAPVEVKPDSVVTFLRLTPLVGG
ncbi:MAG: hypothetical protein AAFR44_03995 [Pseudomonadota bacterium]